MIKKTDADSYDDLDLIDRTILSLLRRNSREKMTEISKAINMPLRIVNNRRKKLENSIISKYTTLVDYGRLNYNLTVHLIISSDDKRLEKFLMKKHNINNLFRKKDSGYYVEALFSSMKDLYDFLTELSNFNIKNIEEHFIIDEIKKEAFMV